MRIWLALFLVCAVSACGSQPCDGQTGACLSLQVSSSVSPIAALHIDLTDEDKAFKYDFVAALPKSKLPVDEAVLLPATLTGTAIAVSISATDASGAAVARGESTLIVSGGHDVVHVSLKAFAGTGCMDGVADGTETDVDCGGSCPACTTGGACVIDTDCASTICASNVCAAPLCANGVKDATETDVDCGGTCAPCADGKTCKVAMDCTSAACGVSGTCSLSAGSACTRNDQCAGGQCALGVCTAAPVLSGAVPAVVPSNKATQVHLKGASFSSGSHLAATVNGATVPVTFVSDTDVVITTPVAYGRHGAVAVTLTTGNGATASSKTILSYYLALRTFSGGNAQLMSSDGVNSAFLADLDNDGAADLLLGVSTPPDDSDPTVIRPNVGGLFVDDLSIPTINAGVTGVGDLNGDGKVDFMAYDTPYFGDGTFHFTAGMQLTGAPQNCNSFLADVDGDKQLDAIYVCFNDGAVLLGHGDGTFGAAVPIVKGQGYGSRCEDLNHDGKADLVLTTAAGVSVLLATGAGAYAAPVSFPLAEQYPPVVLLDYDHDGALDLVVSLYTASTAVLLHNDGAGAFTMVPQAVPLPSGTLALTGGDFDGDGHLDLATSTCILPGKGDGTFGPPVVFFAFGAGANAINGPALVGDFDGDGTLDIGVNAGAGITVVYAPLGPGAVATRAGTYVGNSYGASPFLVPADLDHDGLPDLVALGPNPSFDVYLARSGRTFDALPAVALPSAPYAATTGDFDGDGHVDLVVAFYTQLTMFLGVGDGTFGAARNGPTAYATTSLQAVDVNGDGKLDVMISDAASAHVFLGDGQGGLGTEQAIGGGQSCTYGRIDSDAIVDLMCWRGGFNANADTTSGELEWQSGNGDGTFQPQNDVAPVGAFFGANSLVPYTLADLNGDGLADVVTGTALYTNKGDGSFKSSSQLIPWSQAPAADIDGDGVLDLPYFLPGASYVSYTTEGCSTGIGSPGVRLTGIEAVSFDCRLPVFGDFDGDGLVDLAITRSFSNQPGDVFVLWNRSY